MTEKLPGITEGGTSSRWKSAGEAARAWSDVATRISIVLAVAVILIKPGLFPFLKQFTVKSGEVNVFGSKFEVAEIGTLILGLEIKDGRLLLQGRDISSLPDTIDQLTTVNGQLQRSNQELTDRLKALSNLLTQVNQQRDDLTRFVQQPNRKAPSINQIDTKSVDQEVQQSLAQVRQQDAAAGAVLAQTAQVASQSAAAPILIYGIAFSADVQKENAMTELRKAQGFSDAPVLLFQRERYIRSVAAFLMRDTALKALPKFHEKWPTAYVVDFRTWCPAALSILPAIGPELREIDCRF